MCQVRVFHKSVRWKLWQINIQPLFLNIRVGIRVRGLHLVFSRMRSEGSRFTWGSGGEAVFAKFCVCGCNCGNRSQPSATLRNRLCVRRKALHNGECVWSGAEIIPESCQVGSCRRSYIGVSRGGVCVSDLWRCRYIGVCRGGGCERDLCRRSFIAVCRGGVCESDLCRRSYIGVCRGGVCESDLCRRRYIGVCRGGGCESDLCRRSYIGVCRGGVGVSDLCRRSYQRKFRNLTPDYTESCCWRSVNQEMWSRRCDTAEMWDMRIWRVGSARNAVFFHSFVASLAGKVSS